LSTPVVIWGVGGHALVVADILRAQSVYSLSGFLVEEEFWSATREALKPMVLGGCERVPDLLDAGVRHAVVAIGDCAARLRTSHWLRCQGFDFVTLVHPRATVAPDVRLGAGSVVMAGAVINAGSVIGEHVIMNTAAVVEHECAIGDGVHVGPGVRLAGRVTVGRGTWLGIGTVVVDRVRIGSGSVIGAGSLLLGDVGDCTVAFGAPAKAIRKLEKPLLAEGVPLDSSCQKSDGN
jgi:UDP-N-acetylbacillosamine N-acetyltransferase